LREPDGFYQWIWATGLIRIYPGLSTGPL